MGMVHGYGSRDARPSNQNGFGGFSPATSMPPNQNGFAGFPPTTSMLLLHHSQLLSIVHHLRFHLIPATLWRL
jgi:hypothetical protein